MGKSRPRSISISANQIREFGSSQSLWDRAILNKAEYDAILDQWEREDFYNHLSNYTEL